MTKLARSMSFTYYLLFKPYGYLSQFTRELEGQRCLADLCPNLPKDVYPVGRLDKDSEGLLLLTNDRQLNHKLLNPNFRHPRTYWVQVEGHPNEDAIRALRQGVDIRINKKTHRTAPAKARRMEAAPALPERDPPVRFRANIPTTWIELVLTEGKNRQVRRMCAKVGHPTLRLLRHAIVDLELGDMELGELRPIPASTLFQKLWLS